VDAERGGLEERDFSGAVGGLAPVLGLVVGHVGQNGDLGRHRFVRRPYDRVYLQGEKALIFFWSEHISKEHSWRMHFNFADKTSSNLSERAGEQTRRPDESPEGRR